MRECTLRVQDLRDPGENEFGIGFPPSARYFFTITPSGALKRGEKHIAISDEENLELAMAATNGHAAFAWWKAYGDSFHVNLHEIASIPIPNLWLEDLEINAEARRLGRKLIDTITPENTGTNTTGTKSIEQDSLDFYTCARDTIDAIDELYLSALELPQEPLKLQLHTLRSESTWRLGIQA